MVQAKPFRLVALVKIDDIPCTIEYHHVLPSQMVYEGTRSDYC
jgi:hypothetical protein